MNPKRIALLEEFISNQPEDPFNYYALAMEYYEEDPVKSLRILETLIAEHHNYLPSYYKAAYLHWEFENYDEAKRIFEEGIALALSKNDEKALNELKSSLHNLIFESE